MELSRAERRAGWEAREVLKMQWGRAESRDWDLERLDAETVSVLQTTVMRLAPDF
jgi:hypothetical protein